MFINCLLCAYFRNIYIYITAVLLSTESRKKYLVKFILIYFSNPGAIVIVIYKIIFYHFSSCPPYFSLNSNKMHAKFAKNLYK